MAQNDYVIANANGATVRADINNALLAISSTNSGSSEHTLNTLRYADRVKELKKGGN